MRRTERELSQSASKRPRDQDRTGWRTRRARSNAVGRSVGELRATVRTDGFSTFRRIFVCDKPEPPDSDTARCYHHGVGGVGRGGIDSHRHYQHYKRDKHVRAPDS